MLPNVPEWAKDVEDKRQALRWDASQSVAQVKVNNVLTLAVIDTGAYKTVMDVGMAQMLGLPVKLAQFGECGTYSVPGTGQTNCYAGFVPGDVTITLGEGI